MSKVIGRKLIFPLIVLLIAYLAFEKEEIAPKAIPGAPVNLYSPQNNDNLEDTLVHAIRHAHSSIVLITYTLKSAKIIQALNEAAKRGLEVKAVFDAEASNNVGRKLSPRIQAIPRGIEGLMHLKLLVIDGNDTWLGSANMTRDSLKSHANLVANLNSPEFAQAVLLKANQIMLQKHEKPLPVQVFEIGGQKVELRFLPDDQAAITRIKELIRQAQKSIQIAMYTFTREDLADTLVRAKNRGVKVEVILDQSASKNTNKKIADLLRKNGIPVFEKNTGGLMHNKFMLIDDEILEHGSANWTKAAFRKNDDYIMIISNLNETQKKALHRMWNMIMQSE